MSTKATIYEPISRQMKGLLKQFSTKTLKISPQLLIFQYSMGKFLMESNTLHGYRKLGAEIYGWEIMKHQSVFFEMKIEAQKIALNWGNGNALMEKSMLLFLFSFSFENGLIEKKSYNKLMECQW